MKSSLLLTLILVFTICHIQSIGSLTTYKAGFPKSDEDVVQLSIDLLKATRNNKDTKTMIEQLKNISFEKLAGQLNNDTVKKTFWINLYNALVQISLKADPSLFEDRGSFFSSERVVVAGQPLSLDDIEHGIIRGSQSKLALGLAKKLFVPDYEKKLRVKQRDGRIHFALNCGAKSCPPVAIYMSDRLDEQLDKSTKKYLGETTTYLSAENEVRVTVLFSWFRGDFGGVDGVVEDYLKKYEVIPQDIDPSVKFKDYDWTLSLGNYIDL